MFKTLGIIKTVPAWVWIAGAAGVAFFVIKKGGIQNAAAAVTAGAVSAAGSVAAGVTVGAVQGVGDILNIPRVEENRCGQAKRLGNNWEASKYCAAGDFLQWQLAGAKSQIDKLLQNY